MNIIQSVYIVTNQGIKGISVGDEVDGRVVIEIKKLGHEFENHVHSEYGAFDEDADIISRIENCPVVVEYKKISVDDEKEK